MENFLKSLVNEFNNATVLTENGALAYATTGKNLLDMNFAVSSMRKESEDEIINRWIKAYYEDKMLALKWLFFAGDIREGMGERRLFRVIYKYIANTEPKLAVALMPYVPEYKRWDDLFVLFDTEAESDMIEYVYNQLKKDLEDASRNENISLLAKWLPSVNTSNRETVKMGKRFASHFMLSERDYRKLLAHLRKYLDVVEVKASHNQWDEIDYASVPSKANVKYSNAFMKHDSTRRTEFLESVKKGEAKINASVLFPYDIVRKYCGDRKYGYNFAKDDALEALWNNLPDYVKEDGKTLVIRDGSGSMYTTIDYNSKVQAIDVATSLTVYFAERLSGALKNKFITFSSRPQLVDLSNCETLCDKLNLLSTFDDCSNTNIEATLRLLLDTAVDNNLSVEDMPKNLLIVSDMEFDYGVDVDGNIFEEYAKKFKAYGYTMPRLCFWNVMSRTNNIPVKENEMGVCLVSGFSPVVAKMVLSNDTDPYENLIATLNVERYKFIEDIIKVCE